MTPDAELRTTTGDPNGPLPARGASDYPTGDALYDALSEMLRTRPRHAGEAYTVIREADRLLGALDAHIKAGGALPSPWRRPT